MLDLFLDSFFTVGQQVLILFLLIGVGALCRLLRLVSDECISGMTNVALFIVTPCLLIVAFQLEFSAARLAVLGICLLIGLVFHIVSITLAHLLLHDREVSRRATLRFGTVFTNAGFMSLPLQQALLGEDGVFCGAAIVGVFQFLVWTYGVFVMGGGVSGFAWRQLVFNPGVCGIVVALLLFSFGVSLPEICLSPMRQLSTLNTPLAMLIIGYHLANSRFTSIFADWKLYSAIALRLVLSPLITLGLVFPFRDVLLSLALPISPQTVIVAAIIAASAPAAAITTMFAVRFGHAPALSVRLVSLSTAFSVVTMPIIVGLADFMTK